jgi:uncharacterized protein (DUF1800 family)
MSRRRDPARADLDETHRRARRVLDRVGFGPAPGETQRVASGGVGAWLHAELEREYPPLPALPSSHRDPASLIGRFRSMDARRARRRLGRELAIELAGRRLAAALAAAAPLHERMVDFFANHFSVFVRKGIEPVLLPFWERDVLRRHALGRFEDLLLEGDELFDATSVKVKTPFELVVSSIRATGGRVRDPRPLLRSLQRLGQVPYGAPTPAGFPDLARDWIDPGAMLERTRFAFRVGMGRLRGVDFAGLEAVRTDDVLPPAVGPATRRALATPGLSSGERLAAALASAEFQLR